MRKPLVLVTIAMLSLALAGCSSSGAPTKVKETSKPTPSASATPTAAPVAKEAQPSRTRPLNALTDPQILDYCPDVAAVHFDGKMSDVTKVDICTSTPTSTGKTEDAYLVNFGQDALLSAYGTANAKLTDSSCVRTAKDPLVIWITNTAGTIYPVYAPVDPCGYPSADAVAAYQAAGLQILYEVVFDANGQPTTP